ncbi:PREDICTED: IQ and ubiquitin-like domain-containing protein [Habropoda laboriosa]|uniref:IQ and ubiquitin-like domain-containing protein n=1 Tax=Habropoda laboriosa TaxID=597456 RepID=UPI00083DB226|nr:PREDICTED: IQ and ubiquitin-like domain-containing protein [Habropoda laboriosa]
MDFVPPGESFKPWHSNFLYYPHYHYPIVPFTGYPYSMENPASKTKGFLGGWRSKVTGTVYCNACTQTGGNEGNVSSTGNEGRKENEKRRVETDFRVNKFTNTGYNVAVQAEFFPDIRDRLVGSSSKNTSSGFTGEEESPLEERVSVSQLRGVNSAAIRNKIYPEHLFKRPFDVARRAHRGEQTAIRACRSVSPCSKNTSHRQIHGEPSTYRSQDFAILNRTSPATRADFQLLYNLLDRWRVRETEKATLQLFTSSRVALAGLILAKEVELLRAIDRMKTKVKFARREGTYRKFLDDSARPVLWKNSRGERILVETPRVRKAGSFKDTFEKLSKEDGSVDERRKMLIELRKDIEPHTCKSSDELIRLLDQEIDLLTRRVDESKLNWLRSRSKMAFLRLAREALRNECEDSIRPGRRIICRSCGRLLPMEKFPRDERRRSFSCNYCLYVKARTVPRVVYEPYQRLLRDVRRREANARCYNSLAFVVDAKIVYHLVNDIWHGKSAISENDRLDELRLARLRKGEAWSPWNSVLLTAREASLHGKVDDLEKFYGPMILQKFHTKNLQAKVRFESVAEFKSEKNKSVFFAECD